MRQMHPHLFLKRLLPSLLLLLPVPAALAAPIPTRTTVTVAGTTLSASVRTATGEPVTAGAVDFLLPNGQSLGSALVQPGGAATLVLDHLPAGINQSLTGTPTLPISATYQAPGEGSPFAGSISVPTAVATPEAAVTPDFTLTGNPTTVTTTRGAYATTTITVTSVGGYAGAVQFSCTGLPAQVTCAFNPTQQTLAANKTFTTTLQLETQGPSGTASSSLRPPAQIRSRSRSQSQPPSLSTHTGLALALAFPGALFLLGFSRRRRAFQGTALLGAALLLTAATLTGCSQRYGYLHHPPPVAGGTPTGTFPITVVVDGNQGAAALEHTLSISLAVQ